MGDNSNIIGAFEAKTHFSRIIENVQNGQDYVVTKRGRPVAKIMPLAVEPVLGRQEITRHLVEYRRAIKGGFFDIKAAIQEGRK